MPRLPINYQNTIIYKIVCNDLEITDLYVGHTTSFTDRKRQHKNGCSNENNKKYNLKVYQMIRTNGGWNNWSMIEIEKYSCNDFNEAAARERYYYEELNAKLNSCVPNRSKKEWTEDHKEQNRDIIAQKSKQYRYQNRDKIAEYLKQNKERINEVKAQYYNANRDRINEERRQKYKLKKEQTTL
jgi:hypothetical protein